MDRPGRPFECTNVIDHYPVESKTLTCHGRVGAERHTAGRRRGAGQEGVPTGRFAQKTTIPLALQSFQGIEDDSLERLFGGTIQRNPMETESRNTTGG